MQLLTKRRLGLDNANLFHRQYKTDWLILTLTHRHSRINIVWNLARDPKQNLVHINQFIIFYKLNNCIKTQNRLIS